MNIFFEYNTDEIKFEEKASSIEKYIEQHNSTYKIKVLSKITSKTKCDVSIILSDELDEINYYAKKIKEKEKIIIITSNINSAHVLGCINITPNVSYLKCSDEVIVNRINKIYEKNKNI